MSVKIATIQLQATANKAQNLAQITQLIEQAAQESPEIIVFPEVATGRCLAKDLDSVAESLEGECFQRLAPLAKKFKTTLILGMIERFQNQYYNTLIVIDEHAKLKSFYRKIHLFKLPSADIDESKLFSAGNQPVTVEIAGLKLGLCICFDLRFPDLFQYYFKEKVDILIAPSAFTYQTGLKDWELLIRTRALDTQAYLIAANQYGTDIKGIECYGHSAIVAPNGRILQMANAAKTEILFEILNPISARKSCIPK